MNWLNKHLSIKADLIATLLSGLIVIGGIIILNALIARIHGLDTLGEFLLIKRSFSALTGVLLIGMNIALPNFLSRNFQRSYADLVIILFIAITLPMTIIIVIIMTRLNLTGFDSTYCWVYIIFSLSMSAQYIVYALYRGHMNMLGANIFQLIGTAIIPVIIFMLVPDLYEAITWIGILVLFIMISAFVIRNEGININEINFHQTIQVIKYGLKRIPSFISQFILLAAIPIILAQALNFTSVAYFNSSFSLLRLSLIIVNPIGMVLLPRISNKLASGDANDIGNNLNLLLTAGIVLSVIVTTYCYINASLILQLWLGVASNTGITILQLTIIALPFYTFVGLTQSPIDAISEKGYNSFIYSAAAIVMILIIIIGKILAYDLLMTVLFAFLISYIVAGLLSAYFLQKLYHNKLWNFELIRDIILGSLMIMLIHEIFLLIEINEILQLIITCIIYFLIGILIVRFTKTGWIADLKSRVYG